MRINYLSLILFLATLPSQALIGRASNSFLGYGSVFDFASRPEEMPNHLTTDEIKNSCEEASKFSFDNRLRQLSHQLMSSDQTNDSFELGIQKAEVLLACKDPSNAQKVLQGLNPFLGSQTKRWAILFWQASKGVIDHEGASLALRKLSEGDLRKLDQEWITVGYSSDGSELRRLALDLLAEHERLSGNCHASAQVLLAGRKSGALGARRISRAIQCLEGLGIKQKNVLLSSALAQAEADKAWWLVSDVLKLKLLLELAANEDAQTVRNRLELFAKELDDRYTQLEVIRSDSEREEEKRLLENQLRSPREANPDVQEMPL